MPALSATRASVRAKMALWRVWSSTWRWASSISRATAGADRWGRPSLRQVWATNSALAARVSSLAGKLSAKSTLTMKWRANSGSASCTA